MPLRPSQGLIIRLHWKIIHKYTLSIIFLCLDVGIGTDNPFSSLMQRIYIFIQYHLSLYALRLSIHSNLHSTPLSK